MQPEPDSYLTMSKIFDPIYKNTFDNNIMILIEHVAKSIINAENNVSSITNGIIIKDQDNLSIDTITLPQSLNNELLNYQGMTGTKTRHLYNNIGSLYKNTGIKINYLEIGTWYGSSSISFLFNNTINDSLFIDNWSQFGGYQAKFIENLNKFNTENNKFSLVENDCWKVDITKLPQNYFNIYLFDGDHSELDHFLALKYYLPVLQNTFILLVDDLNFMNVHDGTMRAIRELNLTINFRHEIYMSPDDLVGMPNHKGKHTWWNGCLILVLTKALV